MLKCDMAETYHIYVTDWYNPPFPISYLADLAEGLSFDSRVKRKLGKSKLTLQETLCALTLDKLATLVWQNTKDGYKGRRHPESVYNILQGLNKKKKDELEKFETKEDFESWYRSKMR